MERKLDRDDLVKRLKLRAPIFVKNIHDDQKYNTNRLGTDITNPSVPIEVAILTRVGGSDIFIVAIDTLVTDFVEI